MKANGSVTMTLDSYNELINEVHALKALMKIEKQEYNNCIVVSFDRDAIYKRMAKELAESEFATEFVPVAPSDFSIWGATLAKQVVQDEE